MQSWDPDLDESFPQALGQGKFQFAHLHIDRNGLDLCSGCTRPVNEPGVGSR